MTKPPPDGPIDRLVQERWLAIGLSQAEIAELLDAAFRPAPQKPDGPGAVDIDHLTEIAKALGIAPGRLHDGAAGPRRKSGRPPAQDFEAPQSLLELRLLRAFFELKDPRARRTLVNLAEQIVKRQAARPG